MINLVLICKYIFTFLLFLGEIEKPCVLVLVDDTEHEEDEELRLVLGSPKSESPFGASIGKQNETLVRIKDDADSKNPLFINDLCPSICSFIFNFNMNSIFN